MEANEKELRQRPIFLIKPETERENFVMAPPLGILYLGGALEKQGYRVRLIHERFNPVNEKKIVDEILAADPLFVGISTFTGPSLLPSLRLTRKIKKQSAIPVIWGGLHSTMLPEQTLQEEDIDLAVRGEGEETVVRLADLIASGGIDAQGLAAIPGVAYRNGGRIRVNEMPPFIQDLDAFSPAWHLLESERYLSEGKYIYTALGSKMSGLKIATVMTSRGCPGRCGYCFNQFINKRTFRTHSVEFVVEHINQLKKNHGVTGIIFEDDCLFTDRQRALAILRWLGAPWSSSIRADYLARWGEDFVRELKELGCAEIRIGAESGSQETLDIMQKDIRREHIFRSVELCRRHDINVMMGFMIGVPGERWSETLKTFDIIDEMEKQNVTVAAGPAFYFPYPGTPMFDEAVKGGFIPPASIKDWAIPWGPSQPLPRYADPRARYVGYYRSMAMRQVTGSLRFPLLVKILQRLARWRWRRRFFSFPLDYLVPRFFLLILRQLGLRRMLAGIYDE
ncbi:MAG: B12-binding domain-containing radical SAM protein [Candidatus Aminicenantes bacterium]|nr:B12-binding domain-containing radical SAM protein [Candidatus Aminicenantes bacterium]